MKLYITYGFGSDKRNNFSVVEGKDYTDARKNIHEATGGHFAFAYTETEFAGQPEKYGLTEVPAAPQVKI